MIKKFGAGFLLSFLTIFMLFCFIIISLDEDSNNGSSGSGASGGYVAMVSEDVLRYRPVIQRYAVQYGVGDYVELILAVMMQESGGRGLDPMQASEGAFNTLYPRVPNGITDPEYSIACGVQELKASLERAGVTGPSDIDRIKLALQGYNFGGGYIDWAVACDGGYTPENAIAYSDMMCSRPSWHYPNYGDKKYVEHVLQYYQPLVSGTGEAAQIPMEERMNWLFPNGVPQSERQMAQYLTTITVPIITGDGRKTTMNLTVHEKLADEFQQIFLEMQNIGFPIKAGTTCGYNWRSMVSSSSQSHHSYGVVVDVNWIDNPYVSGGSLAGSSVYKPYINPYSVTPEVVQIWKNHGFYWGGDWTSAKDYMHFTYTNH